MHSEHAKGDLQDPARKEWRIALNAIDWYHNEVKAGKAIATATNSHKRFRDFLNKRRNICTREPLLQIANEPDEAPPMPVAPVAAVAAAPPMPVAPVAAVASAAMAAAGAASAAVGVATAASPASASAASASAGSSGSSADASGVGTTLAPVHATTVANTGGGAV